MHVIFTNKYFRRISSDIGITYSIAKIVDETANLLLFEKQHHIDLSFYFYIESAFLKLNFKGEGEVAVFIAKPWDRRNRADVIDSETICHDAQVVKSYRVSNPLHLTVLASKSGVTPLCHNTFKSFVLHRGTN